VASKKYNLSELKTERSTWSNIPVEALPENKREKFRQRKLAVDMYIDGLSSSEIYERTGIDHTVVARLIARCITTNSSGELLGYNALIPDLKIFNRENDSTVGKFSKLLEKFPPLREYIEGCWYGNKKYTSEHQMNLKTLHKDYFLKECERLGIQDYEYPFNTESQGYYALRNYVKHLELENTLNRAKRSSKDDQQKLLSTGIGTRYTKTSIAPYANVQIDGHKIDLLYTVEYTENDGTVATRIATRMWFFPVLDTATRCVIGYSVSQETNYNEYDVIDAIINSILPHKKMSFSIDGLCYPENGGFPSTAFPELEYGYFDKIMLDNAKSHLSNLVIERMTRTLNCVMDFGSVATPETRGIVERFFGSLETRGFHKLSMTTGSSTHDLKRKNPEHTALKTGLTYDMICQLLEILIAQYNNTPHSSLGNRTPLECLGRRVREAGLYPSIADASLVQKIRELDFLIVERMVRGRNNGKRAYIYYKGVEYRNIRLSTGDHFIGHKITLSVDPRDISTVEAYDETGEYIGTLKAHGEFGTKSHSLKTRQMALRHARERGREKAEFDTPITALTQHLDQQAKGSKRAATRRDIIRREMGASLPSESSKNAISVKPFTPNRKFSEKANLNNMPTAEEADHMSSEEMIERLWGGNS